MARTAQAGVRKSRRPSTRAGRPEADRRYGCFGERLDNSLTPSMVPCPAIRTCTISGGISKRPAARAAKETFEKIAEVPAKGFSEISELDTPSQPSLAAA